MRRFLAALCLAAVTALINIAPARADNPAAVFDQARARVFITVSDVVPQSTGKHGRYLCTGFFVRPIEHGSMVASAGHCPLAPVPINLALIGGHLYRIVWLHYTDNEGYDSAIGVTDAPYPAGLPEATFNTSQKGDELIEVGFGWGQLQNVVGVDAGPASTVSSDFGDWEVIQGDKPIKPGMSGSPVFNARGEIVGIHVYGIGSPDEPPTVLGGFTKIENAFKVWTGEYKPQQSQPHHIAPPRIITQLFHLGLMHGQGDYFDLLPSTYPSSRTCADAAVALNGQLKMYRYICVHVQD